MTPDAPGSGSLARVRHVPRAIVALLLAAAAVPAAAEDELSAGAGRGLAGRSAEIALSVRDRAGTLLDEGDGAGFEIQGFAVRIEYPAASVTSCDFVQAGVTLGKATLMSSVGRGAGYCYVLFAFAQDQAPLTFRLDRPAPGDLVGNFRLGLAASLALGESFAVTLVAATALLDNGEGTLSESVANGHLVLVAGSVTVSRAILADAFESGTLAGWSELRGSPAEIDAEHRDAV